MQRHPASKIIIREAELTQACKLFALNVPLSVIIKECKLEGASRPSIQRQIRLFSSFIPIMEKDSKVLATEYLPVGLSFAIAKDLKLEEFVESARDQVSWASSLFAEKTLHNIWYASQHMKNNPTVYRSIKEAFFPSNMKREIEGSTEKDFEAPIIKLKNVMFDGVYPIGTWDTNQ